MEEPRTIPVPIPSERSSFIACVKGNVKPRLSSKRNRENRLYSMTQEFVKTYKKCNADFKAIEVLPQRVLTNPSEGVLNNGFDNEESNLVCKVHDTFAMDGYVFTILDLLGTGTFGQVFRCIRSDTKELVAVKVVKNKPAYHAQGLLEIKVARLLNEAHDPNDERHIVRLLDSFEYRGHVCLVFELLSVSLLDVLTQNQFRGLPLVVVQRFAKQILTALVAFEDADVIHCDLKPENILLVPSSSNPTSPNRKPNNNSTNNNSENNTAEANNSSSTDNQDTSATGAPPRSPPRRSCSSGGGGGASDIKVIDFGSACFEGKTMYSYIQSRFYRSPEVLLGLPYNGAIDMWSLACVCAEMFLGLPLFPGVSQHNQLTRIVEMLGIPPDFLIEGKHGQKYFTIAEPSSGVEKDMPIENSPQSVCIGSTGSHSAAGAAVNAAAAATASSHMSISSTGAGSAVPSKYRLKTAEEFAAETNTQVPVLRKYLRYSRLDDVIMRCPLAQKSRMTPDQKNAETLRRRCFLDFLQGLFRLNPFERWTARQAFSHPFIENTRFVGPYVPSSDMKINERKLNFMVLTQRKPPPSTTAISQATTGSTSGVIDAGAALTGVRAPSNFSTVPGLLGNAAQFTPLQLAHRRMSDPGLEHNRIKPSGPQLLKRGAPAHLPPEPEPTTDSSALISETSIPFSSESSEGFIAVPAVEIARPPSIERSDSRHNSRRNSGNFGEHDDYATEQSARLSGEKSPTGGHVAHAILRVNSKSRDVLTANSAVATGAVHSKPPTGTGSPTQLAQPQQLPYSAQQQSQSLHSSPQTQMYMHQYRQHQQNFFQRQHQQPPNTGSPNSKSGPSFPPPRAPYGQHHPQQQQSYSPVSGNYNASSGAYGGYGTNQAQQMASSMHMHPSGMPANHSTATGMGTSYNSYGYVGSMQDAGGGVMLTDFALALMRPDMDEQRRLMSQTTPQQLYWQHSYAHGSSPGGMGGGGSYGYGHQGMDAYANSSGMPLPALHQATSYGFPFNMAHMDPRSAHTGYHPPGQVGPPSQSPQMAGSFDSKTMHGRRRQPPHKQDRNISSSNLVEFAAQQQQQQFSSRQLPLVPADGVAEESRTNNNNVKRLSGRMHQQNKEQYNSRGMSMLQTNLLPSDAHLRKPSPTYGNKEIPRTRATVQATATAAVPSTGTTATGKRNSEVPSSSILINNASPQQLHLQSPTVVAGSYVDAANHTSFHALQPGNATLQQPQVPTAASATSATVGPGQSFLAMEIERRESFAAASVAANNRDRSSPCSTSASNSSVNSAVNSRQNSVDSADVPHRIRGSGSSVNSSATSTVQRLQHALGTRTLGRTAGMNGSNRTRRKSASNGQQSSEDVLEEWHPFFEADDLNSNA